MSETILEMKSIVKTFSGVSALKGADLTLKKGEVMALLGENGAGKSTLMKILTGIYDFDDGEIIYKGKSVRFKNAMESRSAGIAIIHQEFNLFPNLTAAENIFLSRKEILTQGMVDWKKMNQEAQKLLDSIGGDFSATDKVSDLTVQNQQVIEIVKALSTNAEILIMDEPTSALPENEVQSLFKIIRSLQNQGVSIIYVSHRLNEVFEICQSITILRDGLPVGRMALSETNQKQVITQMIGKEVEVLYPKKDADIKDTVLEVKSIGDGQAVKEVSFNVRAGEILGLYGLIGSGATECPEVIFGINRLVNGSIYMDSKPLAIKSPGDAIRHGIAYVPPDRHRQGIIKQLSIRMNLSLVIIKSLSRRLLVRKDSEKNLIMKYIDALNIKTSGPEQKVNYLSGGNQQKVVISKWLASNPKVLIMNDPTRGVDVGAKAEIYALISDLACKGMAIILTSSEMSEILGMADRIIVFNKGKIKSMFPREEATQQALLTAAISD